MPTTTTSGPRRVRTPISRALTAATSRVRRLLPLVVAGVLVVPASAVVTASEAHATPLGGPVVLDGMDSGNHGTESAGVPQGTWHFGELAFQLLMGQSSSGTPNTVAVVGATDSTATGGNCGAMAHWAAAALGYTAEYFPNESDIDSLFAQIHAGTYTPRLIYVTDTHCLNGLTYVNDGNGHTAGVGDATLAAHSTDLASFVNRGGALYTEFSGYTWLRALLPSITVGTAPTGSAPLLTSAGIATFPTLTNADLVSPWHGYFEGSLGSSLQALASQTLSSVNEIVVIGGSDVTLPTISTATTSAIAGIGTDASVTTTAENPDGTPIAGATVTFTISSGPNAGATANIVTDANGVASYTYTSATAGTDVFATSVTVAGQTYPGSATIVWQATHPTPPAISAVSQTGSTAVATITPPVSNGGGSSGPTYTVKAYPGGIASGSTPIVVSGAAGPTVTLTGLNPSLTYELVAIATNNIGPSSPSPTTWVGSATTTWAPYVAPVVGATAPAGQIGTPYAGSVAFTGGVGPYTWSLVTGPLPAGLTLNANGSITGTPTTVGPVSFVVSLTDGDDTTVTQTVTLTVDPPPPTAAPVTSAGSGGGTQSASVTVPPGGSVALVDPSGNPVTVLTVAGVGTYAVDSSTGAITFVPARGFTGTAPAVPVRVTDAYSQSVTTTYTVTVTKPAPPQAPATPPVSSGAPGTAQQTQISVPIGDTITLLDAAGRPATSVSVPGQGRYVLNPVTGVITFTPVAGFHGRTHGVTFQISDGYGQSAKGVYVATVSGTAPAHPTVRTAAVGVLHAYETHLPVTCRVSFGRVAMCTVTLFATVDGHSVVVGSGRRTITGAGAKLGTTVAVTLNHLGKALSSAPGGVMVTASVAIKAPGQSGWSYASSRTRLVEALIRAPQLVYFATASAVLTAADETYLNLLRHQLVAVREVVCNGYTDSRDVDVDNVALGKARAAATCAYLLRGLHIHVGAHTFGASRPAADNATAAGQALNRRAEVYLRY